MNYVIENIKAINDSIENVCKKIGKKREEITLIAVTKTVDTNIINFAIENGVSSIGENKVQEIVNKYDLIEKKVHWHLIGHLQTNKVKYIIDKVDLIHSVDSFSLAEEINKKAEKTDIIKDVLIQVNVADEESKFGIALEEVDSFVESVSKLTNIKVRGLMTIAPNYENPEMVRPVFRVLKEKFDQLAKNNNERIKMDFLSMGMTNDYIIAIEEGSNMVRIGTGIFGKRNYNIL